MSEDHITRQEVEALLAARQELGPSYDQVMAESFADRIERAIADRVDVQVEQQRAAASEDGGDSGQVWLGLASLGAGIPITAIAGGTGYLPGLIVAWVGIVGVNMSYALRGRRRRPSRDGSQRRLQ